jgi:hypothetical protein
MPSKLHLSRASRAAAGEAGSAAADPAAHPRGGPAAQDRQGGERAADAGGSRHCCATSRQGAAGLALYRLTWAGLKARGGDTEAADPWAFRRRRGRWRRDRVPRSMGRRGCTAAASGSGGIREAAPGLFPGPIAATQLTPDTVKGILHQSGTILRTSDRGEPRPGPGARGDAPRCRAHRAHRRDRVLQRDLLSLADVTALGLTARGMADRALKTSSSQGAEEASARPAQSRERRAGRTRRRPGPRQLSSRRGR